MSDDAPTVGLVGDGESAPLRDSLEDAGLTVVSADDAGESADGEASVAAEEASVVLSASPDVLVAVGESAVGAVVASEPSVPMVPIDADAGIRSVPADAVDAMAAAIAGDDYDVEHHVPLSVAVDGDAVGTAVFDVTLVTGEAARISEYAVAAEGDRLDRTRADGVVVATPAGSTGYARRVGAPVLAPATGVAVAWIAPFSIDPDRWVVDPAALSVTVHRDETAVDLLVDGTVVASVDPSETVSIAPAPSFSVATVAASRERYG